MTLIGEFDPADQLLLMQGLEAAAVLISTASLGRKEETASEGLAMANYVLASASDQIAHPLLMSIIAALEDRAAGGGAFPDYGKVVTAPGARDRALGVVRSAVVAVDVGATPDEASAYRVWLLGIATSVAQAGKEDQGFLGRGGVMVNDAERAALAELAGLLGLEAPTA
jgi:tellurite resistance protein